LQFYTWYPRIEQEMIFMNGPVLVTGASGVLGRAIVAALSNAGILVRQGVRSLDKAKRAVESGVESVRLDYTVPATFDSAMKGMRGLVLMAPPLDSDAPAKLGPVIAHAKKAGIGHIVFISAFGVNHNAQAPLRIVEHMVIGSGVPYTILRPNFFMENFSQGSVSGTIGNQNAIFVAAGDGKTSFISVRDIAAAVVAAFRTPLTGREFDLTGPEALDHTEIAKIIAEVSARPVVYHALTEEQMTAGARAAGMPEPAAGYLAVLYGVVRAGYAAGVTSDVKTVTGKEPISFRTFAEQAAPAWK
jgi:uncharacterized protein YbjT (DUF2867 family)